MKKTKLWLIIGVILMVAGIGLAAVGTVSGATWNWRFNFSDFKIHTGSDNYIKETKTLEAFDKLIIDTSTIDINITKGNEYSITYFVPEDRKPEISSKNGVTTINFEKDNSITFLDFSFMFNHEENSYVNITIPDSEAVKVIDITSSTADIKISSLSIDGKISTSTGDIRLEKNKMGDMGFSVSTGDIYIDNCSIDSLETKASTGEVKLTNSIITGKYTSKTSTGDVTISGSELDGFTLSGSTSDVTVSSSTIENIKLETSTGDIKLGLNGTEDEYSIEIYTSTGDIDIDGEEFEKKYKKTASGTNSININTSTGDVDIDFGK